MVRPEAWMLALAATGFMLLDAPWLAGIMLAAMLLLAGRLGFPDVTMGKGYAWLAATLSSTVLHVARIEAGLLGYGDGRIWLPVTLVSVASALSLASLQAERDIRLRAGETLVRLKLPSLLRLRVRLGFLAAFAVASGFVPSLMLGILVFLALNATVILVLRRELGYVIHRY